MGKKWLRGFVSAIMMVLCFLLGQVLVSADSGDTATYNGHTYQRFEESKTWTDAKKYCEGLGGHLVTITSSGEQEAVKNLVSRGSKKQYWLGGTSQNGGTWVTGEVFGYTNWAARQPDNYRSNEYYMQMYRVSNPRSSGSYLGTWNDISNNNYIRGEEGYFSQKYVGFICEWDDAISLNGAEVSLKKQSYKYNGSQRKPSVKSVILNGKSISSKNYTVSYENNVEIGQATVRVTGTGKYTGSATATFEITPSLPGRVRSLSIPGRTKSSLDLKWKRVKHVDGYQIEYYKKKWGKKYDVQTFEASGNMTGLDSNFSRTTARERIKNLDSKTKYYVRVRAYIFANGEYYYGKWSSVKKKTTKK
ncbi:MAG: lectin-like protein [Eubacteriales bacterium]|nr:lectin-like protein [Eubacteriales bacterium]